MENFYPLMVLTNWGGLGVGTTQPDDNLTIENPDGSGDGAEMDISGLYIARYNGREGYISDVANELFSIYTNGGGGVLRVNDVGMVGIDIDPEDDLSLNDANGDGGAEMHFLGSGSNLYIGTSDVNDTWFITSGNYLSFFVNGGGTDIMDVEANGLDLNWGDIEVESGEVDVDTGGVEISPASGATGALGVESTHQTQIALNSTGCCWGTLQNDSTTNWSLGYTSTRGASNPLGTPVLSWTTSAQVGIGTTTPQATLDINGYARLKKEQQRPGGLRRGQ